MARLVFIVSRELPELAQTLRREFADNHDVDIIIDRRIGDRRMAPVPTGDERRRADRRQERVDERLHAMGWAIVWRHANTTVYVHQDDGLRSGGGPAPNP